MLKRLYQVAIHSPKMVLAVVAILTLLALTQIKNLAWETDARVYFPKGHSAIIYDEHVADTFGASDAIIVTILNEDGIFNTETLERIARITTKIEDLPGVVTQRRLDVASLSTAGVFEGDEMSVLNRRLMETVPTTQAGLDELKALVFEHSDIIVGNLVSHDSKAAMIRAKLKEGIEHRYQVYFQIKGILSAEFAAEGSGDTSEPWAGNKWTKGTAESDSESGAVDKHEAASEPNKDIASDSSQWGDDSEWGGSGDWDEPISSDKATKNGDRFFIAGRPVIEVTSGLDALKDLKVMIPLLILTIAVALFAIFRTIRGVFLPIMVVAISIIWTMGLMSFVGVPMYTISTMLPVILVAVGIGDAIHLLSHYEDIVVDDIQRDRGEIVSKLMGQLGLPLLVTTLTTAVGFLSLWWADMPPFRIFGIFTAIGIVFCWLSSILFVPAVLTLLNPHVHGYLKRRRSLRVQDEAGTMIKALVGLARVISEKRMGSTIVILSLLVVVGYGTSRLYVDSSWIGDFSETSEVAKATNLLNEKFDGTIFLSVVVEGKQPNAIKNPALLGKIEKLQAYVEKMEYVGNSLSLVDYIKSTNKAFHAGDSAYEVLPESAREISEFLFLLSMSGRPEQLDSVVDYEYRQAHITFSIKTDHTQHLQKIINEVKGFVAREFAGFDVDVNMAGSANNSYIWADLLIHSQALAIILSKLGILIMAILLFRSVIAGVITVIPVTVTTILVAGVAGWMLIPMDVSTVLAAGVAIGVGVDYTVHYIFRYARERQTMDANAAGLGAMRAVGKPIVFNAIVVSLGFLVLGLSQFPPHVKLGYFVAAYMVTACFAALILLPLAFAWFKPKFSHMAQVQSESDKA